MLFNSLLLLLALVLHAPLLARAQTCTNNYGLYSTTSQQTLTLYTNQYTYSTYMQCVGGTRTAVYASFTPPSSGYYYVRVPSTTEDLVMEIRSGATCEGSYLSCNDDLDGTTSKTGFNSVYLVASQTYVILVSHLTSLTLSYSVQLEVGLATTTATLTPTSYQSSCTNNPLVSTTSHQTLTLYTNQYTYSTYMQCGGGGTRNAVYASFTPPYSGSYYVRVPSTSEDLIMEIRTGATCTGTYLNCNDDLGGSTSKTGFNSIALAGGQTYVILISRYSSSAPTYSVLLEVGLVSSYGGGGSGTNSTILYALGSTLLITIIIPCVIFGLAFIIAMALCCKDGPAKANQQDVVTSGCCGTSSLAKIRKLAIATWLFSILVWVFTWAVVWSSLAYFLSFITFILGAIIHSAANSPNFAQTGVAQSSSGYKTALLVCGTLLLVNMVVAVVNVAFLFIGNSAFCSLTLSGYNYSDFMQCYGLLSVFPAYGLVATIGMIVLGAVSIDLGITVHSVASKMVSGGGGVIVNSTPMGGVVLGYPQQQQQQYPQGVVMQQYPQGVVVQSPQQGVVLQPPQQGVVLQPPQEGVVLQQQQQGSYPTVPTTSFV